MTSYLVYDVLHIIVRNIYAPNGKKIAIHATYRFLQTWDKQMTFLLDIIPETSYVPHFVSFLHSLVYILGDYLMKYIHLLVSRLLVEVTVSVEWNLYLRDEISSNGGEATILPNIVGKTA